MLHVYGIKNCTTVKKALDWLDANGLEYVFHDYKKEPATADQLAEWEKQVPWEALLNKKGTTWRRIPPEEQAKVRDAEAANAVLLQNNSMIKRPLITSPRGIVLGFDEREYAERLKG